MLLNDLSRDDLEIHIEKIITLIRDGRSVDQIKELLKISHKDEIISIAKARIKDDKEQKVGKHYLMTSDDLRFATNIHVARWRAKRLACDTLVEIGCGIGVQSIEFAKTCKNVISIDIDARKVSYAWENAKKGNVSNITFVDADGIDYLKQIKNADVIFVDPERLAAESQRTLDTIKPSIPELIKNAKHLTDKIAIELPPQIKGLTIDGEYEYTSVDGELNRLTLYLGALAQAKRSAVALPSGVSVQGEPTSVQSKTKTAVYLYEPDPALIKAELLGLEGCEAYDFPEGNLLASSKKVDSPLLKHMFRPSFDGPIDQANATMQKHGIGRIVLRGSINPKIYWLEKKKLEEGLSGNRVAHVFVSGDRALVCDVLK